MEAGETERHPMRTFLVGGATGRHLERIRTILAEQGFSLEQHVPGESGNRLPKPSSDIEVIVVLVSHTGHPMYWAAKETGKARGLPVVLVESAGIREDLRKERQRLGLGAWERMGADAPIEPDGWWTWDGLGWSWTTPSAPSEGYLEEGAPVTESMSTVEAVVTVGLVAVAVGLVLHGSS